MPLLRRSPQTLSVAEAEAMGVASLLDSAESGTDVVVERHHRAVTAIVGMDRLRELEQREQDLQEAVLVLARTVTDNGRRHSLEEVLGEFGFDDLSAGAEQAD